MADGNEDSRVADDEREDGPDPRDVAAISAAISARDLQIRLYQFADDSMQGRQVGRVGNKKGTDYLAAEMKRLGLRGVMMPGNPAVADYDDPIYAPFYEAAVDLGLPLSFHILTSSGDSLRARGPRLNGFLSIIRGCQDIIGMFVLGGVFERHPKLKLVCVEADAGWVPHFMYRMDHAWERHRYWLPAGTLTKKPSEYFRRQCWISCEPDEPYLPRVLDFIGEDRILFASDYPHPDHKWPETAEAMLAMPIPDEAKRKILWDNPAAFYGLDELSA